MALAQKLDFWSYRVATVLRSFKKLYTLTPQEVKTFVDSYEVYDLDWTDEAELIRKMGPNYSAEMTKRVVEWYGVLNHLCALGQVEKMYIPPALDLKASIIENQKMNERQMAKDLGLKKGSRVLDIGCGRGRVAAHMASHTGSEVYGINVDPDQLAAAEKYSKAHNLPCHFQKWDLNVLPYPFPDAHFDGVYDIQVVFSLAKNLENAFREIHRLLKPGGKFVALEWVTFDSFNQKDPKHAQMMKGIKPLIGAIGARSASEVIKALKAAGFDVKRNENPSVGGYQAPLIENADKFFTRMLNLVHFLVKVKILPVHFRTLLDRFTQDGEAFVEAEKNGLLTTSYYVVAEKK